MAREGATESRSSETSERKGVNSLKVYLGYLQLNETGHAADALRDGAGELVAVEPPAAVGRW